jgi:cell division protein FtsB
MAWVNRILVAALLAGTIAYVPHGIEYGSASDDLARVRGERKELQGANARIRQELRLLKAEVDALKRDPREVERIAREDLNLVRPDEVVFEFEPASMGGQP